MPLAPEIAIHVTAAIGAVVTGPIALWARRGRLQRPKLHRAFGYAWVTLMIVTAISALFIQGGRLPNIAGFSPIHLLVPVTLVALFASFYLLAKGNITGHRLVMQRLYIGACVVAGSFTLLPNRFLGHLVLGQWLGIA
ncbi:MAG: putative rane protein [Ramlibacter sp.]|nr:putative rane protein [Ramlibacter sp.]